MVITILRCSQTSCYWRDTLPLMQHAALIHSSRLAIRLHAAAFSHLTRTTRHLFMLSSPNSERLNDKDRWWLWLLNSHFISGHSLWWQCLIDTFVSFLVWSTCDFGFCQSSYPFTYSCYLTHLIIGFVGRDNFFHLDINYVKTLSVRRPWTAEVLGLWPSGEHDPHATLNMDLHRFKRS